MRHSSRLLLPVLFDSLRVSSALGRTNARTGRADGGSRLQDAVFLTCVAIGGSSMLIHRDLGALDLPNCPVDSCRYSLDHSRNWLVAGAVRSCVMARASHALLSEATNVRVLGCDDRALRGIS